MPVDTQHPDYAAMAPVWKACRDVAAGQRAVHADNEVYLRKLDGESAKNYGARKARALFFNATWRTIAGLLGMLFRKDPTVKVSAAVEPMLKDVTQGGIDLVRFAGRVCRECLTVGRVGVLVDFPAAQIPEGVTVAEVEALNLRPKMALYQAESIINWDTAWVDNKNVLTRVVLREYASLPGIDEFSKVVETRYRVLDLVPLPSAEPGGAVRLAYRVRVFKKDRKADVLVEGPLFPLMNGKPVDSVPFVFISVDDTTPAVEEPPLIDLVDANISHYQSTADVEHGAHKTALPQPYATGLTIEKGDNGKPTATFYMGGGELWAHPDANGTFGMLEYTGKGLDAIEKRLERKEAHMAVLGARMLEDQKKGVETAEVAGMHRSGEQATLSSQAKTASQGINIALGWFDKWAGGPGETEFDLNREFLPTGLTALEITALVGAWQQGTLSDQELFGKFQRGGVVNETTDFETHEAQIENSRPRLSAGLPATGGAAGAGQ